MTTPIYDFPVRTLNGSDTDLSEHRGKVLLIVNTASECGFTPQLGGLQKLPEALADDGLAVLGFPCNQFGRQEPGTSEQIGAFCQKNYGVSFRMHEKIEVNGKDAHPLYAYLKSEKKGLLGTAAIKWNFTKFLVDREGHVVARYGTKVAPADLEKDIRRLL